MKKNTFKVLLLAAKKYKVFLLAAAMLLPFLSLILSDSQILLARDISRAYLPYKFFLAEMMHRFQTIPTWDFFSFSGFPYIADPNYAVFHPANLLFYLFPIENFFHAYALFTALHLPILFLGTYYLLKQMGHTEGICIFISMVSAWCGVSISAFCTVNILASYASLPWFWLFLRKYLEKPAEKNAFLLSTAIFFPTIAGDPQFSYGMILVYLFCAIYLFLSNKPNLRKLYFLCLPLLLSAMAGAAQILPTLAWLNNTERTAISLQDAQLYSVHPMRLLDWILPQPFGNYVPEHNYWGGRYIGSIFKQPFVFSYYPGAMAVFLTFSFILRKIISTVKKPIAFSKNNSWLVLLLFLLFAFSLGEHLPISLYEMAFRFLPGFSYFRYPERFVFAISIILTVIIAHEASYWLKNWERFHASKTIRSIALIFTFLAAVLFFFHLESNQLEQATIIKALFSFFLVLCLNFIFLAFLIKKAKHLLLTGLILISAGELLFYARFLIWNSPKSITNISENIVAQKITDNLKKRSDEIDRGGAFRYSGGLVNPEHLRKITAQGSLDVVSYIAKMDWMVIKPHLNHYFGISTPAGYGSLTPKQTSALWLELSKNNPQALMNLFSIYYYSAITSENILAVRINPEALPYFRSVNRTEYISNFSDAQKKLLSQSEINIKSPLILDTQITQPLTDLEILSVQKSPDKIRVLAKSTSAGQAVLAWNESFDQNWSATVNGMEAPLMRANAWSSAILVQILPGTKQLEIVFSYRNRWLTYGIVLSSLWLALGICFFALNFRFYKSNKI